MQLWWEGRCSSVVEQMLELFPSAQIVQRRLYILEYYHTEALRCIGARQRFARSDARCCPLHCKKRVLLLLLLLLLL
jgi:hypothetical protein